MPTYDLRDENDEIWGLGIGCNGLFRVLLQPLLPGSGYAPFAGISAALLGDTPAAAVTVIESGNLALPAGATVVLGSDGSTTWLTPDDWREPLVAAGQARIAQRDAAVVTVTLGECRARVLCAPLRPIPPILVLGAGLDAVPLVDIANRLGWRVTIADHRPLPDSFSATSRYLPRACKQTVYIHRFSVSSRSISERLRAAGISPEEAGLRMVPTNEIELGDDATIQILKLVEALDELDDILTFTIT